MNLVKTVKGFPLGIDVDNEDGTASVAFVLEGGDHLYVQIDQPQLQNLSRHIAHAISQLPAKKPRR